jgi:glycosyltransferase involved in cell wall biosynthesis
VSQVQAIHQVVGKSSPGYSVSNYALALQDALRHWGYDSIIYASEVDPGLAGRVRPLRQFRPRSDNLLILHYVMANDMTAWVKQQDVPLILCYHNITPSHFFTGVGNALTNATQQGRAELAEFQPRTRIALTFSAFSKQELIANGYQDVHVLPILIPTSLQQVTPDESVLASAGPGPNLLFVGRIAPNKRCEDVIKILHQYRQIEPRARLFLVGARRYARPYADWLHDLVHQLGLADAVIFTGHVSEPALAAYYRIADIFIMMSEHEGFGMPLVESMRFDVPVMAYASTAVPETLGGAGILIRQKRYDVIAELINQVQTDAELRAQIIKRQQARVQDFDPDRVLAQLRAHIEKVAHL